MFGLFARETIGQPYRDWLFSPQLASLPFNRKAMLAYLNTGRSTDSSFAVPRIDVVRRM
mgnify:FL=1